MNSRLHMIAFDGMDPSFDPLLVRDLLKMNGRFTKWWNHVSSVFIVKTDMPVDELTLLLSAFVKTSFVAVQLDMAKLDGFLPPKSWEWIRERQAEATKELA